MEGGAREPPSLSPPFLFQCQSNQKNCLLRISRSPVALAAPAVARCPLRMRAVRSAPRCENQGGPAAITAYSSSDLFAFNAERRLFLSPHVVSPSHTRSHILGSRSPALPFALWGKAIGRNDSPSGEQPRPRTSPAPWLSQVPGLQCGGVVEEVRGRKEERL